MTITKVTRNMLNTGIVDNSNATAITIDSSENVGIGTASPSGMLHVQKDASETNLIVQSNTGGTGSAIGGRLRLQLGAQSNSGSGNADTQAGDTLGQIVFEGQGTDYSYQGGSIKTIVTTGDGDDGRSNQATAMTFDTLAVGSVSPTERMRIASSGGVAINNTSPHHAYSSYGSLEMGHAFALTAAGSSVNGNIMTNAYISSAGNWTYIHSSQAATLQQMGNGIIGWYRGAAGTADNTISWSESMRIDSSGNLLIGKTSTAVDSSNGVHIKSDGTVFSNISSSTTGYQLRHDFNNRFFVTHLGVINAQTTSISGISDERLKENIVDLETGLTEVLALKPRRFNWVESEKVPTKNIAGFIAQEVETVLPDLIGSYEHDRIDNAKSLRMGDMIPTLVKAIQELTTKLEAAEARITTLEG